MLDIATTSIEVAALVPIGVLIAGHCGQPNPLLTFQAKRRVRVVRFDEHDVRILRLIQREGHLTSAQVADRIGMSQSPCWRRINKLEADGVIARRLVLLDRKKLGFHLCLDVRIKLSEHGRQLLDEIQTKLSSFEEVQTVHLLLGEIDFAIRVVVRDLEEYETLLRRHLTQIQGVQEIRSSVILSEIKSSVALPI